MANGQYIGVNGVARKVTAPYIGVDGVARKITEGYVGVDGVARPFWSAQKIVVGTLYLRPNANISVEHDYGVGSYTSISEEVADDDSSRLSSGGGSTSTFSMGCADAVEIHSVSAASLAVRSCFNTDVNAANQIYSVSVNDVQVETIEVALSGTYTTYTSELSNILSAINDYISSNGEFPSISLTIEDEITDEMGGVKRSPQVYTTQAYIELTCEYVAQ